MPKHSQRQVSVLLHTVQYACPLCVGVFRLPPVLTWKTDMIFCRRERGGLSPFDVALRQLRHSLPNIVPSDSSRASSAVVVRFVASRASIYPFLSTLRLSVMCSITNSLTFPLLFQTVSGQYTVLPTYAKSYFPCG